MKFSKTHLLVWCTGFLMPVWLIVADRIYQRVSDSPLSGRWLYASILVGALICAAAILISRLSVLKRIVFVAGSWVLLGVEVLALGAVELSRTGLAGIQ
jgi:hypothetical protein